MVRAKGGIKKNSLYWQKWHKNRTSPNPFASSDWIHLYIEREKRKNRRSFVLFCAFQRVVCFAAEPFPNVMVYHCDSLALFYAWQKILACKAAFCNKYKNWLSPHSHFSSSRLHKIIVKMPSILPESVCLRKTFCGKTTALFLPLYYNEKWRIWIIAQS